jgi:hypothetical protein
MMYSVFGNVSVSYILAAILALLLEIPLCSLLISRYIVSTSHPVRPLLARHLLKHQDKSPSSSLYPLGGQLADTDAGAHFASFKYNGGFPATTHPNHNIHLLPHANNNNHLQKNANELTGLSVISTTNEGAKENSKF